MDLAIASPEINPWIHNGTMNNLLFNIKGTKEVILFPSEDLKNVISLEINPLLRISMILTFFKDSRGFRRIRFDCQLNEGEPLFTQALWCHNVASLNFAISINVF